MGLPITKVTLTFLQGPQGWTENYYIGTTSPDLTAQLSLAETLASKRAAMSGAQTIITYVKVSNESTQRDVLISGSSYYGNPSEPSDAPDSAILVKRYAVSNVAISPLYCRGVWDSLITAGGNINYASPWISPFNSWTAFITASGNNLGFTARDPSASKKSLITNIVSNADGTLTITIGAPDWAALTVGANYKAFVSKVLGAATANGPLTLKILSATTAKSVERIAIFPYTGAGQVSVTVLKFFQYGRTQLERVVERKVGRPLYASRGRQPVRVRG
jgi:hypothetical protein